MSSTTKKKHVCREVLDDYVLPSGSQEIVRVQAGRGNNLHEVIDASGKSYLVSMPTKFRKSVWIKRGDFVIVEPIEEGDKVQAEIVAILYRDQIRYIKRENLWPVGFDLDDAAEKSPSPMLTPASSTTAVDGVIVETGVVKAESNLIGGVPSDMLPPSDDEDEDYDSEEEFVIANPNRPQAPVYESSSEEEEEDDDDDEVEEEGEDSDEEESETGIATGEIGDAMKRCHVISPQAQCKG